MSEQKLWRVKVRTGQGFVNGIEERIFEARDEHFGRAVAEAWSSKGGHGPILGIRPFLDAGEEILSPEKVKELEAGPPPAVPKAGRLEDHECEAPGNAKREPVGGVGSTTGARPIAAVAKA